MPPKSRDPEPLIEAMTRDLEAHRTLTGRRKVTSVYFGGGTPSLLTPAAICGFLKTISDLWPVHPDVEITLEANPEDVSPDALKLWEAVGINRISLGVQALNDEALTVSWSRTHNQSGDTGSARCRCPSFRTPA